MKKKPALFMEYTEVPDTRSVAEIQDILARRGARAVMTEYDDAGMVAGVAFRLRIEGQEIPFRLPCRWQAVMKQLKASGKNPRKNDTFEWWARRVAWRQILRWVEAQLALIETGQVKTEEVFMPYMSVGKGTLYELIAQQKFMALPNLAGQGDQEPGTEYG